jgi:hypothetical protein
MNVQATPRARGFRPIVGDLEDRRLMSVAVVEVLNRSSYNVTASYRWSPTSAWSTFKEAPGQGMLFWANMSGSLAPQVFCNTTTSAGSQMTFTLVQGYGQWSGSGTPPAAAARVYQFQNTTTGLWLYYAPTARPAAPSLTGMATSPTQVKLSWNGVSNAAGYYVDEWINGAWSPIGTMAPGTTACTVGGLSPNATYYFLVGAFNAGGITWSANRGVTTSPPSGPAPTEPAAAAAYSPVNGTLFGLGGPSYLDVNQGVVGDCWLLSSLAAVAVRYPADIKSMFTYKGTAVAGGATVGVYTVRFYDANGIARYVTVDTELPGGGNYYDRPNNGVLWVALAEKAYAEANGAGYVTTLHPGVNSYAALDYGYPSWAIQAITGSASSYATTDFSNLAAAWASGKVVVISSDTNPTSSLIIDRHCYAVVGYNASSNLPFTVYNPWGPSTATYNGHSVFGLFTASAGFLAQNYDAESFGAGTSNAPGTGAQRPSSPAACVPPITLGVVVPDAGTARAFPAHPKAQAGRPQSETIRLAHHAAPRTVPALATTESERHLYAWALTS